MLVERGAAVPGIRTIRDMRSVLADPAGRVSDPLYYMYRDLARLEADRAGSPITGSAMT